MSENILAQFLRSEKDLRPFDETIGHRAMLMPVGKSGYNNSDVSPVMPGLLHDALQAVTLPKRVYSGDVAPNDVGENLNFTLNMLGGGTAFGRPAGSLGSGGIRAYHGSPHDFDKFDISKIGTGEGAQAYGHGLYFAENEGVAKQYRDTLSAPVGNDIANIMIKQHNGDVQKAIADLKARPGFDVSHSMQEAVRRLETGDKSTSSGRMYEVNIKADPEHFLDWDKPLSQQSGAVKGFIDSRLKDGPLRWDGTRARDAVTGEIVGRVLSSVKGGGFAVESPFANRKARFPTQQEALDHFNATFPTNYWDEIRNGKNGSYLAERLAAEGEGNSALRDNGIPGIKYLDQGSRGAGEGSRNYVVFSDKDIEIIRKYGMAAFLAMGGAAATQQPTNDGPRNVLAGPF